MVAAAPGVSGDRPICVIGAGMAGFGAAHRLHSAGAGSIVVERHPYYGGHTATFQHDGGFTFDDGPHISFTRVKRIQDLLAENVGGDYNSLQASVNNYWRGHWVKHPAQCNLYGLPTDVVKDVLKDFVSAPGLKPDHAENYEQWLIATYGEYFARNFPMEYTVKYHTTEAANMSTDWIGPRMYQPDLEEVIAGALAPAAGTVHYIDHFRYPKNGGFAAYLEPWTRQTDLRLDHEVTAIDPSRREVRFANGASIEYGQLVSSMPLPALIACIEGVPDDVREAAERLTWTQCVMVNVVIDREDVSSAFWTYFYDPDICFTRLSFPHMFSPQNVPPGAGSVQAEIYFSNRYRPLDRRPEDLIAPVIADLEKCGYIRENDKILFKNATLSPYAQVIFDQDRARALAAVHGYLDEVGILYCGRFGEWEHIWTDEAFMSGENAAQRILDGTA